MKKQRESQAHSFDFERAKKMAVHYNRSTGANCQIIDATGQVMFRTDTENVCVVCQEVQAICGDSSFCRRYRRDGAYYARHYGGKYIFLCPMGLVNWASPITVEGVLAGAFLSGSYLMTKPNDKLVEASLKKQGVNMEQAAQLIGCLENAVPIDTDRVTSLSEMLFLMACHISDIAHLKQVDNERHQKSISSISEYIHHLKKSDVAEGKPAPYPVETEKALLEAMQTGKQLEAHKCLNEIVGYLIYITGSDFRVIRARILELLVIMSRSVLDDPLDNETVLRLNERLFQKISELENLEELILHLNQAFDRLVALKLQDREVKHVEVIYQAIQYVDQNHMHRITLDDTARHVHLSPNYFSTIFRNEMKVNFPEYLGKVRTDKSKSLLMKQGLAIKDIAQMVGFNDQNYYTKIFRKNTGLTPAKFRKSKGKMVYD